MQRNRVALAMFTYISTTWCDFAYTQQKHKINRLFHYSFYLYTIISMYFCVIMSSSRLLALFLLASSKTKSTNFVACFFSNFLRAHWINGEKSRIFAWIIVIVTISIIILIRHFVYVVVRFDFSQISHCAIVSTSNGQYQLSHTYKYKFKFKWLWRCEKQKHKFTRHSEK